MKLVRIACKSVIFKPTFGTIFSCPFGVTSSLADAAVEITETGTTIKAHGLRIVCDLLHTHMKHARECTMLTTRCTDSADLRKYGVVVDERSGRVREAPVDDAPAVETFNRDGGD